MKIVLFFLTAIGVLFGAIYFVAFTASGNALLIPTIEQKLNESLHVDAKIERFRLRPDAIELILALTEQNKVAIEGTFSAFTESFDIAYDVMFDDLTQLRPITKEKLYGRLYTDGTVRGDMKNIAINGKSDIASSQTTYDVKLVDFNPVSIVAEVAGARSEELLAMIGKAPYALAKLDIDAAMRSIDPKNLDGDVKVTLEEGIVDTKLMRRDFNLTLPKTAFAMHADAKLRAEDIDYALDFNSNLAKILSKGVVSPETLAMDLTYNLACKELALLKPITDAPLRGKLNLKGSVKGDKKRLHVKGSSDIAASKTAFSATLRNFAPKSIQATIAHLQLPKLLYMVEQPHYLHGGKLDATIDIADADMKNLSGSIISKITEIRTDGAVMQKTFDFAAKPDITMALTTKSHLKGSLIDTKLDADGNLFALHVKSATFDTKKATLASDYRMTLKDLRKLYFVTEQKMRGAITFTGELQKDSRDLYLRAFSKAFDGTIDAKLEKGILKAKLTKLQTLRLLYTLYYPEIFASSLNGDLRYVLKTQKGLLDANLSNGKFTKNQMADLLKRYAKYDLYKDMFEAKLGSKLTPTRIDTALDMRGGAITIKDDDMILYPKTKRIKSELHVIANRHPVTFKLSGNIDKPNIEVDASELIKKEASKAIEKEIGKLLKGLF